MSTNTLAKNINPVQLAAQNSLMQGQLPLSACERLLPLLRENTGTVDFSLQFMQDEKQRAIVRASINTECILECRRCLQSMAYKMRVNVELAVITDEKLAADLPENYEPLVVTDTEVALSSLIEDELLLNLPVMPIHSETECTAALPTDQDNNTPTVSSNPFAVLKHIIQ